MPTTVSSPHLAYNLTGPAKAPVVVFVNGLGGAQAAFTLQVKHFAKTRRVLTYDHRGLGGSEIVDRPAHMADFASDLVRILDELDIGLADFVGLSFGGRVLQQLAAGWSHRVRRMVLSSTSGGGELCDPGNADTYTILRQVAEGTEEVWSKQIAPLLFGPRYVQAYPERIQALARWRARYPQSSVGIARQWEAWDSFDLGDQLQEIDCPVLVLHGSDDALSPVSNGEALVNQLPNATFHLMGGIGHSPNVEDARVFNQVIEDFLSHG
jgi:3-oxoadipate enol-lactonase